MTGSAAGWENSVKQYWLLQVTGWGLFYAIDSMLKVAAGIVSYPLFIAVFILYGFAMAASHCLRIWYRRWQRLPLLKVVAGVITASLLGAGGATSLMLGTLWSSKTRLSNRPVAHWICCLLTICWWFGPFCLSGVACTFLLPGNVK